MAGLAPWWRFAMLVASGAAMQAAGPRRDADINSLLQLVVEDVARNASSASEVAPVVEVANAVIDLLKGRSKADADHAEQEMELLNKIVDMTEVQKEDENRRGGGNSAVKIQAAGAGEEARDAVHGAIANKADLFEHVVNGRVPHDQQGQNGSLTQDENDPLQHLELLKADKKRVGSPFAAKEAELAETQKDDESNESKVEESDTIPVERERKDIEGLVAAAVEKEKAGTNKAVSTVPLAAPPGVSESLCRMEDDGSLTARGGVSTSPSCLLAYGGSGGDAGSYVEVDYTAALYTKYAFDIRFSNSIVGDNNTFPHGGVTLCNRDGLSTARRTGVTPRSPEFWFIDRNSDFGYGTSGWEPPLPSQEYMDPNYYGSALPVNQEEKHWEIIMRFDSDGYSLVSWSVEGVSFDKYSGNVTGCPLTGSDHAFVPRVWTFEKRAAGSNDVSIKNFQVFQGSNLGEMVQTLPPQHGPADQTSVVGDPHVVNVAHERFEIRAEGQHKLVQIPHFVHASGKPDLRVDALIEHLVSNDCSQSFMTSLSIVGRWAEDAFGQLLRISKGSDAPNTTLLINTRDPLEFSERFPAPAVKAGRASLTFKLRDVSLHVGKHFEGRYGNQQAYLNLRIAGLKKYRDLGGLLGHDGHADAEKRDTNCTVAQPAAANQSSFIGSERSVASTDGGSRIEAE